jgi:hypothetical protein
MTQAPPAVFKIPTKSPQPARKAARPAGRAKAGHPAGRRVLANGTGRAATRGGGEVIELEYGITVYPARESRRERTGPPGPGRGPRGPRGPRSRLAACGWYQRRGNQDRRRSGGCLPCQRSGGPADIRAQARGDVRQDLPPLGAQPDG